jgi:hypothetical protein
MEGDRMRAMNALGRRSLYLQNTWAACGAGITGTAAALFVLPSASVGRAYPYNNYYDLRNALTCHYR